ncbi:hypothetical protein NECID01_0022 [Nematocida sp. AWRm77]|nr:hypothetical protein NECID01_0022 [Nematocida sp. AWRm77]
MLGDTTKEEKRQEQALTAEPEDAVRKEEEEEKDEEVLFTSPVVLYRYKKDPKGWVVRGKGKITVARHLETGKHRIYHVREKVFKLGCNHYINKSISLKKYDLEENCWMWITFGDNCGDSLEEVQTFLAKFPSSEESESFYAAVEKGKACVEGAPETKDASSGEKKDVSSGEKAKAPETHSESIKPSSSEASKKEESAEDQGAADAKDAKDVSEELEKKEEGKI